MIKEPLLQGDAAWKRRFRLPRIHVQLARGNPNHALVTSNQSGIYELYSYDLLSDRLRQATHRASGTYYGEISPDGRHIYYVDDKKGNETGHVVRIPFEGGDGRVLDMTPSLPDYTLVEPFIDGTSSHMGVTIPSAEGFDSYVVAIVGDSPQEPHRINRSKKQAFGPIFSQDGKVSVVISSERFGGLDFNLISFDTKRGERLFELADEASKIEPASFSPIAGDQRVLAMSNRSGVMRPLLWDAAKGRRTDLDVEDLEGDVVGMGWSPNAKRVLLNQTNKATTCLWLYDLGSSKLTRIQHPEGMVEAACFQTNDSILMTWQDSANPTRLMSIDLRRGGEPKSYLTPKDVPKSRPWLSASFSSTDGQELQCWYATPDGDGPFLTILETHGGPTLAQFNVFSPRSQIWLDHGFAFASVNYRGSTTFGKEFEKKINGDLGHWEVEDMVAARQWLVKKGIARSDGVFLTGWSYGGYLTLQAMGLYPELWAGGMGGIVVADWVSEYEDEPEAMRGYDVALNGGTPAEKPEVYARASPINYLERLAAPLLIIQGKNDVRCPPRQVELYEAKAKSLGKDVEVVWFETGHAGSGIDVELGIAHHEIMLRWMYRLLAKRGR